MSFKLLVLVVINMHDIYLKTIPLDHYPCGKITTGGSPPYSGQLPPRTITPIGKLLGIILTAPPSLTGNRGEYFRVVEIPEMVEERGRYL